MTEWRGKVHNDVRFADHDEFYDQEFGKPHPSELDNSGYGRSRTTYFRDTVEHEERSEGYLLSEASNRKITKKGTFTQSASQSRRNLSPSKQKEDVKQKPKKDVHPPKDLGPDIKREIARAAELKLGTKLNKPQSLFDFWKNHIKERPAKKKDEFGLSMSLPPKPQPHDPKPVSEKGSGVANAKSEKMKELNSIYDKYKTCRGADVMYTLKNIDEKEKLQKERIQEDKKVMMQKAKKEQKEQAVKKEIQEYFKRYMDKKI